MNKLLHPLYGYPIAAWEFLSAIGQCVRLLGTDHQPDSGLNVSGDFFGINVAPGEDSSCDDYILERLADLGLRQVRMDFSYSSIDGAAQRLLERLLSADIDVMLDLLPPIAEAKVLFEDVDAQQRWRQFLSDCFHSYEGRVSLFEIGSTPNRGKWSGFSSQGFILANYIGHQVAADFSVQLVGPNVSDFEPLYNATYLGMLKRLNASPNIHSDNLFVERVLEPEAYDHRVLGSLARAPLRLNLIKKARMLQKIGERTGSNELMCTYTCWTIKRLQRRAAWPEQKRVDYLVRYLALASASNALSRVYWGPLICSRDGLIDDGADDYPVVDQVSFYEKIRGKKESFAPTPAFHALAYTVRRLAGARCLSAEHDPQGLSVFQYCGPDQQHFIIAWTRDGQAWPLTAILPEKAIDQAVFFDEQGAVTPNPLVFTEHPVIVDINGPIETNFGGSTDIQSIDQVVHLSSPEWQSVGFSDSHWHGANMLRAASREQDLALAQTLHPSQLLQLEETQVLRDTRNRLWNVADPRGLCEQVTVKLNRAKGIKRFTYRFYPSKGRRHWNNACDMLRKNVATPLPIAFFESHEKPGINDSWYLCQFVPDAFSARDVYASINRGESHFKGLNKNQWFEVISGFVCHMHDKQIIHRDLSSGNLLLSQDELGEIHPMAIDIGRVRAWSGPGSKVQARHRMLDLIRIAYKLNWNDRQSFIEHYEGHFGKSLSPLWRIPFWYYDSKQTFKKALKGKRRQKPPRR
ncbi:MAG: lipopolysaccharide kinase InaA family protein [Halioglobus sp.]